MASKSRFKELALEERRIEAKQEQRREQRKMELELEMIEEKRLEREAEAEQKKLNREAEQIRIDREAEYRRKQTKLELEMKRLELEGARAGWYEQRESEGAGHDEEALGPNERGHDLDRRTKHFGYTLRHALPSMLFEISVLPHFFDTIEKLYQIYQVPVDLSDYNIYLNQIWYRAQHAGMVKFT